MRILLIILTVIGILLLTILAFVAVCLFYPVSYQIKGEAEEELFLCGRFRWLFGLFRFDFDVRDFKPGMRFGILWWNKSFGREEAEEEEMHTADGEAGRKPEEEVLAQKEPVTVREGKNDGEAGLSVQTEADDAQAKEAEPEGRNGKEAEPEGRNGKETEAREIILPEKHSIEKKGRKRRKRVHAKARAKPRPRVSLKKRAKAFKENGARKRDSLKDSYLRFRAELADEKNHMAVRHLWQEATYIFSHFKPKYANGAIYFAAGDPALTGQLTGALSLLPVMYQYDACVCPDFAADRPYIRGTVVFGGKMSLYHAALCLIRIIRDENAMKFIQKFR